MKQLFIEAKYKEKFTLPDKIINKLPKQLTLATTVQFIDSIEKIKQQLEKNGIKVKLSKGKHSKHNGQILGCDIISDVNCKDINKKFLYIGDGLFHPKSLLLKGAKEVFTFNPFTKELNKITQKEIEKIKKKIKGALLKFKTSKNIGVIITKKLGQNRMQDALKFKTKWENNAKEQNNETNKKNIFLFLTDTLDFNELENFPFIECWINTMCPRIGYDDSLRLQKPIINIDDVE